jgi:hypothetical protein
MLRDDSINRVRFDSLTELAGFMRQHTDVHYLSLSGTRTKFYGNTTGEQALHYAVHGNDRNVPAAQQMLDRFAAHLEMTTLSDEPTVAGCYPVVAEFLAGEPECMRLPAATQHEAAPLSIFVDLTCSAGIKPSAMQTRGTATLAAVMALSARRPITLEVGCVMGAYRKAPGLRSGEQVSLVSVVLDTAPLDLSTAAWVMSDVAAARRLVYGASSVLHDFDGSWPTLDGCDHGAAESEPYCERVRELLALPGDTLYLPAVSSTDYGNHAQVFRDPLKWAEGIVTRFSGALQ